jgi:hypothetical protein
MNEREVLRAVGFIVPKHGERTSPNEDKMSPTGAMRVGE